MAETLKLGVIGIGQVGKRHIERYAAIPGVEIVGIADINEQERQRVASANGIPHAFRDYQDLLALDELDAVDVCVHNTLHAQATIAALEAGKHVFCEKPMAGSYRDALAMAQAAQRTGRRLGVQLASLFRPETKAARRLIDAGALGQLYYGRAVDVRRRGRPYVDGYGTSHFVRKEIASGGALIDHGIYAIGQLLYLLGSSEVLTISGTTEQQLPMYEDRRQDSGYDVEEFAAGLVRLAGGITLALEVSWAQHYQEGDESKLLGSRGGLRLKPLTYHTTLADMELSGGFDLDTAEFRLHACDPTYDAYDSPQHHWVATLQGRVPGIDTAALALGAALIGEGLYLSRQLGREVTADEILERSML